MCSSGPWDDGRFVAIFFSLSSLKLCTLLPEKQNFDNNKKEGEQSRGVTNKMVKRCEHETVLQPYEYCLVVPSFAMVALVPG